MLFFFVVFSITIAPFLVPPFLLCKTIRRNDTNRKKRIYIDVGNKKKEQEKKKKEKAEKVLSRKNASSDTREMKKNKKIK